MSNTSVTPVPPPGYEPNPMKIADRTGVTRTGVPFLVSMIDRSKGSFEPLLALLGAPPLTKPIEAVVFVGYETLKSLTSSDPADSIGEAKYQVVKGAVTTADGAAALADSLVAEMEACEDPVVLTREQLGELYARLDKEIAEPLPTLQ